MDDRSCHVALRSPLLFSRLPTVGSRLSAPSLIGNSTTTMTTLPIYSMRFQLFVMFTLSSVLFPLVNAKEDTPEADDMGPAAFMWPPDREWVSFHDNIAPCGTPAPPINRTEFPLSRFLSAAGKECRRLLPM